MTKPLNLNALTHDAGHQSREQSNIVHAVHEYAYDSNSEFHSLEAAKNLACARQSIHDVGPEHGFRPAGCNFYTRSFHVEHEACCEVSGREVSGDGIEIGCGTVYI